MSSATYEWLTLEDVRQSFRTSTGQMPNIKTVYSWCQGENPKLKYFQPTPSAKKLVRSDWLDEFVSQWTFQNQN